MSMYVLFAWTCFVVRGRKAVTLMAAYGDTNKECPTKLKFGLPMGETLYYFSHLDVTFLAYHNLHPIFWFMMTNLSFSLFLVYDFGI